MLEIGSYMNVVTKHQLGGLNYGKQTLPRKQKKQQLLKQKL